MNRAWYRQRKSKITVSLRSPAVVLVALATSLNGCGKKRAPSHALESDAAAGAVISHPPSTPATLPTVESPRPSRSDIEGVVLITLDALRADQPWVGYDKVATPNLTKLARSSIVYTRAYSLANLTTASVNALLASRYASELDRNLCTIGRYEIPESLAPTLQAANVFTSAAQGHAIFVGHTAPSAGFDQWRLIQGAAGRLQKMGAVTGNDVAEQMLLNVRRPRSKKKWFTWSHFVDPHQTYVAHSEYPVTSTGDRGRYDSEVAYTDAAIGRVLKAIESTGLAETTAILVTSDHGEPFGEHGFTEHGFTLYEEEIRVPLIVHIPGAKPRQIEVPRSAIDVAPTIADLLGVTPPTSWHGASLQRDLETNEPPEMRSVLVDVPEMVDRPHMQAVIRGYEKVVFTNSAVRVYDLAADPDEKSPLSSDAAAAAIDRAKQDLNVISGVGAKPCLSQRARSQDARNSEVTDL